MRGKMIYFIILQWIAMKQLLFIIFMGVFNTLAVGKDSGCTELLAQLRQKEQDTNMVRLLLRIYDQCYVVRTDSMAHGMNLIMTAYQLSLKLKDNYGIVESCYRIGGNLNYFKNQKKAIEYYFRGLKYAEESSLRSHYSKTYIGIGLIFYDQKKWDEAQLYFNKAIALNEKYPQNVKKSTAIYLSALCFNEKGEYARAVPMLSSALKYAGEEGDSNRIHECLKGMARAKSQLGETQEAMRLYAELIDYYTRHNGQMVLTLIHKEIADIWLKRGDLDKALKEALTAYENNHTLTIGYYSIEITELLSKIYAKMGNSKMAYQMLLEHQKAMDSAMNRDILAQISVTEAKYDFEKKENKYNQELEQGKRKKNLAILFAIIFAIFILFGTYFYIVLRRERRKSERLLLNVLPKETAAELKKFGKAIPKKHNAVSIMFCDIKEFTRISESLSPEALVSMLDTYISAFDEIVLRYGLEKIKTIGDAYMCAAGLHSGFEDHALRTVKAALEILAWVRDAKPEMQQKFGHAFTFRIGIHTGPLVSGVVGSNKYAYDVWGDTVNTAARMEEKSEAGRINISASSWALVKDHCQTSYRGKLSAKNKAEMDMYFVDCLTS